jgi:environmental stress-induced protein Ves
MIIRLQDRPSQPWKNGMGSTRELAVQRSSAGSDDFLWRVSIAEVDSAAPFSSFPGIERQIVLLDGNGFRMTLDDGHVHALVTPFEPFAFPGEAKVSVDLIGGSTRDFNLMLRRAQASGDILVWRGAETRIPEPSIALVYCARGRIDTVDGRLQEGDAWRPDDPLHPAALELHQGAVALAVRIDAK